MYDFRMNEEEILMYINENRLPERLRNYKLNENELLQYAITAASITYIQKALKDSELQMPRAVESVETMIEELKNRGI